MAPLSELPPMPPPPPEELEAFQTPTPHQPVADSHTLVTVRFDRRLGLWLTVVGWPLFFVTTWASLSVPSYDTLLQFLLRFPPLYAAILGIMLLVPKNCLTYDARTGQVGGAAPGIQRALAKWRDGDRIDFSVYEGTLYIVRPDGKRRRIVRGSLALNRADWVAFVDVFLMHQQARQAAERADARSRERGPGLDWLDS